MKILLFTMQIITVLYSKELQECNYSSGQSTLKGYKVDTEDETEDGTECFVKCQSGNDHDICSALKENDSKGPLCISFSTFDGQANLQNNPIKVDLCIRYLEEIRKLMPYGYDAFQIQNQKFKLYEKFEKMEKCEFNDWYKNKIYPGYKMDNECFPKCSEDKDCNMVDYYGVSQKRCYELRPKNTEFDPENFDYKEKPMILNSKKNPMICRTTPTVYKWTEKSRNFEKYGFYHFSNIHEFGFTNEEGSFYSSTVNYKFEKEISFVTSKKSCDKKDTPYNEFIVLNEDQFGICRPPELDDYDWSVFKKKVLEDYLGKERQYLII